MHDHREEEAGQKRPNEMVRGSVAQRLRNERKKRGGRAVQDCGAQTAHQPQQKRGIRHRSQVDDVLHDAEARTNGKPLNGGVDEEPGPTNELKGNRSRSAPRRVSDCRHSLKIRRFDNVATRRYIESMKAVGVRELKNRLSEYIGGPSRVKACW